MSDRFPIFDVVLERRRRRWVWAVRTNEGMLAITGSRSSRSAARYEAHRALFLTLLSAPYRSRTSGREIQVSQARARRSLPRRSLGGSQTGVPNVAIWSCAEVEEYLRIEPNSSCGERSRASRFSTAKASFAIFVDKFQDVDDEQALATFARTVDRTAFGMHGSKRAIFPHSSVQRMRSALHGRSFREALLRC